jgi:hypothetical protein
MKLIGRTLAVLAAALIVVGFWLAIGSLRGSTAAVGGMRGGHIQKCLSTSSLP